MSASFYGDVRGKEGSNAAPLASRSHLPASKAELSTLQRSGTFYFALTLLVIGALAAVIGGSTSWVRLPVSDGEDCSGRGRRGGST